MILQLSGEDGLCSSRRMPDRLTDVEALRLAILVAADAALNWGCTVTWHILERPVISATNNNKVEAPCHVR